MKKVFFILLGMVLFSEARADPRTTPEMLEKVQAIQTLPPEEAMKVFQRFRTNEVLKDEAKLRLSKNSAFIEWLPRYFRETPILFENLEERQKRMSIAQTLPAEWAIRMLVELSQDDRPMTSTQFDYDDPEFIKKMAEMAPVDGYHIERFEEYGFGPPGGANQRLAVYALIQMNLAGAPTQEKDPTGVTNPGKWLRMRAQAGRIPEIAEETWGERAILNADLGLGPDNLPLSGTSASTGLAAGVRRPPLPPSGESSPKEGGLSGAIPKDSRPVLYVACGLLVAGLAAVGWRWMKAN
jgi:hypothetical protein